MLLQLTDLELIHGIFTLVLVVTYLLVGLKIALKYFSTKNIIFLLVQLFLILSSIKAFFSHKYPKTVFVFFT